MTRPSQDPVQPPIGDDRPPPGDAKRMRLRYAGPCRTCGTQIEAGVTAVYHKSSRTVSCVQCQELVLQDAPASLGEDGEALKTRAVISNQDLDGAVALEEESQTSPERVLLSLAEGVAGASARREFDRRHAKREERVRERFPRMGGLLLAIMDDPQSTTAWVKGAVGEEKLGVLLSRMAGSTLRILHDRGIPGTRSNIDHVAVGPAGVFVIDAKRYKGRIELRVEGGLLRPRVEKLMVSGRDRTKIVDGVLKQVALVSAAVGSVPVTGMLCFVEGELPLLGGALSTRGVSMLSPRKLARVLVAAGPLDVDEIERLHHLLAKAFPASES